MPSPSPSAPPEIDRVTASDRQPEPIGRTSRPTFVVDRSRITDEGARALADALVGVPGVELFAYGPFGAEVDLSFRGASSERTLVLIDGQPVDDPTTGAADRTEVSTVGVQRVEIVESAASALSNGRDRIAARRARRNDPRLEFHYATPLLSGTAPAYRVGDAVDGVVAGRCVAAFFHRHFLPGDPSIERFVGTAAAFAARLAS